MGQDFDDYGICGLGCGIPAVNYNVIYGVVGKSIPHLGRFAASPIPPRSGAGPREPARSGATQPITAKHSPSSQSRELQPSACAPDLSSVCESLGCVPLGIEAQPIPGANLPVDVLQFVFDHKSSAPQLVREPEGGATLPRASQGTSHSHETGRLWRRGGRILIKPKAMHWKTYLRLCTQIEAADTDSWDSF